MKFIHFIIAKLIIRRVNQEPDFLFFENFAIEEKVVLLLRRDFERGRKSPLFQYPEMSKEEIIKCIDAFTNGTDLFLVDVHLANTKLAVFIDKPAGVQLDECSALNRQLNAFLEPSGFLEKHDIEVSSPGMDMPLKVPRQYLRRIGREIRVISLEGVEAKGVLQSANDEGFEIISVTEKDSINIW